MGSDGVRDWMLRWLDRLGAALIALPMVFLGLIGAALIASATILTSFLLFNPLALRNVHTGILTWLSLVLLAGAGASLIAVAVWGVKRKLRALDFKL
jgi:hypothetical protein